MNYINSSFARGTVFRNPSIPNMVRGVAEDFAQHARAVGPGKKSLFSRAFRACALAVAGVMIAGSAAPAFAWNPFKKLREWSEKAGPRPPEFPPPAPPLTKYEPENQRFTTIAEQEKHKAEQRKAPKAPMAKSSKTPIAKPIPAHEEMEEKRAAASPEDRQSQDESVFGERGPAKGLLFDTTTNADIRLWSESTRKAAYRALNAQQEGKDVNAPSYDYANSMTDDILRHGKKGKTDHDSVLRFTSAALRHAGEAGDLDGEGNPKTGKTVLRLIVKHMNAMKAIGEEKQAKEIALEFLGWEKDNTGPLHRVLGLAPKAKKKFAKKKAKKSYVVKTAPAKGAVQQSAAPAETKPAAPVEKESQGVKEQPATPPVYKPANKKCGMIEAMRPGQTLVLAGNAYRVFVPA